MTAADFLQATASGNPESGGYGPVRNNGTRFHEGVDIKPVLERTRRGDPTDPVFAIMDGDVVHFSDKSSESSYGRYVVLRHVIDGVQLYSLYAHLASVDKSLKPGIRVNRGDRLGVMGHSAAGYSIPRDRSHLHLEIGVRLGDNFQAWYDRQKFGSPNYHGDYNGMNLVGFNPLDFYSAYNKGQLEGRVATFVQDLPTAYILRVVLPEVPDFVRRNPGLLTRPVPEKGLVAWEIAFTWYGLPKQWTPLTNEELPEPGARGSVTLQAFNRDLVEANRSRDTVQIRGDQPVMRQGALDTVRLLFDMP